MLAMFGYYFEKQSIQHTCIQFVEDCRALLLGWSSSTRMWALTRPNRPKCGYWPDQTDQNVGSSQTKQTAKCRNSPHQTDRNACADQTKPTEMWVLARPNKPKTAIGQTEGATQFFPEL